MNHIESLVRTDFISSFLSGFLSGSSDPDSFGDCPLKLLHVVLKYLTLPNLGGKPNLPLHHNADRMACNSL